MKIDRLLGIVHLLLQKKKVTADYLSQTFEVSKRTILRDINTLCSAGIPIRTESGYNGGISLMEGYRLDSTFLSKNELSEILLGLKALKSIDKASSFESISQRFPGEHSGFKHMHIDLSGYYKNDLIEKFGLVEKAIEEKHHISFMYHSQKGSTLRQIKPYAILFQWGSWYIWGFCERNQENRMFKINRMTHLTADSTLFTDPIPSYTAPIESYYANQTYPVVLWFSNNVKWRVIDDYGFGFITKEDDEGFEFRFSFDNEAYLFQWLLSFGSEVKVLHPAKIRDQLINNYQKSLLLYKEGDE